MNTLLLMRGAPGSGKSTWIKDNGLKNYTLCADDIRLLHQSPQLGANGSYCISQKNDKDVWELLYKLLEDRMSRGEFCVVDACHSKPSDYSKYKKLADRYRYRIYAIDFSDVSLNIILDNNRNRPSYKVVPNNIVENMYARIKNLSVPKYVNIINYLDINRINTLLRLDPLDYNRYEKIILFGDTHSCYDPLAAYFKDHPEREDYLYIHLGDIFDRGPQTKEMGIWLQSHFNRSNWLFLQSNHNLHLSNLAFNQECKSNEFKFNTLPKLLEVGDQSLWRQVSRKFIQCAYFKFADNIHFCNHGGISTLPVDKISLVSSNQFYKGVGKYEEINKVAESWNLRTTDDHYQWHGHRSFIGGVTDFNIGRSYNLNGNIEFDGGLKVAELNKDGSIYCRYYSNSNILKDKPRELAKPESHLDFSNNENFIRMIREHNGIRENKIGIHSSFNFKEKIFKKDKWDELTEIARGLFINNTSNEIVARGWKKSFNLNEKEFTQLDALKKSLEFPCEAYIKYNGFLGLLGYDSLLDQLVFCSKSSTDSVFAHNFKRIFTNIYPNFVINDIKNYLKSNNKCMAFEVIDPVNDPHIIEYYKENVVLLDIIDRNLSFHSLPYKDMKHIADSWNMCYKGLQQTFNNFESLENFINSSYFAICNHEGFMVTDNKNFSFKLKTPEYTFWKKMRGILYRVKSGHGIKYSKLYSPPEQEFVGWLLSLDRNYIPDDIITARNMFFKRK